MKPLVSLLRWLMIVGLGIWLFISGIVGFFVIDRMQNPGTKGISDLDLRHYMQITIYLFAGLLLLWIVTKLIYRNKK